MRGLQYTCAYQMLRTLFRRTMSTDAVLHPSWVKDFAARTKAPFGFNGLGEFVFQRTYARPLALGGMETWADTVARVVNGTYAMQREHIQANNLGWNEAVASTSAQEMFGLIYNMKFLPPGRGLWAMGSPITRSKKLYAALNNCAFVSTANLRFEPTKPFCFLMDAALLGVGVGFDTKGAGSVRVRAPDHTQFECYAIPDSREGFVESVNLLLLSYLGARANNARPALRFDYSAIRPTGALIKGFGGTAAGPGPLVDLHDSLRAVLDLYAICQTELDARGIVDIMNIIGKCVVAGGVRRTAEIAFGEPSAEFMSLKNYELHPDRAAWGWASNNSVLATLGMDYTAACANIQQNGEPGFAWLENMRAYGRMADAPNYKDARAAGGNPCLEQTLESYEMCCLVETFPANHASLDEYLRTLKYAFMYAKTVTLGQTHWPDANKVMMRNRRIGCSMSGIAQFLGTRGSHALREWCDAGYETIQRYDKVYSDWFGVPLSIKTTSIKPSGTVSLLAGATPGMHYPESRFYARRVRLSIHSELVNSLKAAGYNVEPDVAMPAKTVVVTFPVDAGEGVRTAAQVPMWEQLALAAFLQRFWADNQVSCTVTFDPVTEGDTIKHALEMFQYHLKGISFLPRVENGAYAQMPYEAITQAEYDALVKNLKPLNLQGSAQANAEVPDKFCDNQSCSVVS